MMDKRNWDEPENSREVALKALAKAKKQEAKKKANGAHFCKVGNKIHKLNYNKSKV